jgi:hypothetical protein
MVKRKQTSNSELRSSQIPITVHKTAAAHPSASHPSATAAAASATAAACQ